MLNQLLNIPFDNLTVSPHNVRVVIPTKPADAQLIASVLADGILQNLVAIKTEADDGLYANNVIEQTKRIDGGSGRLTRRVTFSDLSP